MPIVIIDDINKPVNVLQGAAVDTNGEASYGGLSTADAYVLLTATDDPTGTSPSLEVVATPIDPADGVVLASGVACSLSAAGTTLLIVKPSTSGAIEIVWNVTGSWTGVNITIIPNGRPILAGDPTQVATAQLPSVLGQLSRTQSVSVVLAGDQTVVPVSIEMANSSVTSNQGNPAATTNAWPIRITDGSNLALVTAANAVKVDGSFTTQPVSDAGGSLTVDSPQLPPGLGQKAASQSVSVVVAGDQSVIPVSIEMAHTGVTANQGNPAVTNNAWPIRITDGTNLALVTAANAVKVDNSGVIQTVSDQLQPTFYAVFDRISPAANKYMAMLFNSSLNRKMVIQRVWVYDWQGGAVAGVVLEQQMLRVSARTAGTSVSPVAGDPNDTLSAGLAADTNSTAVTDGSLFKRIYCTNEEEALTSSQAMPGTSENTGLQYSRKDGTRGIVVRQGQGFAIKNITSNTNGSVSYVIEFTDETA